MCFVDGRLLGDEKELLRWALHQWDYRDFRPEVLYQAISEDFYTKHLKNSQASSAGLKEECEVCGQLYALSDKTQRMPHGFHADLRTERTEQETCLAVGWWDRHCCWFICPALTVQAATGMWTRAR